MASKRLRSLLFAPGNRPRMLAKVGASGADAVVIDLEDAVPLDEKAATREAVKEALRTMAWPRAYVRVNTLDQKTPFSADCGFADLAAVVGPGLAGVIVPKVESAAEVARADRALAELERAAGLAEGTVELMPLVETALGVLRSFEIAAACHRVPRLLFGAMDFTNDIGVEWTPDGRAFFHARSQLVLASRAAGKEAPIDTVYPRIDDPDGLAADTRTARDLGFQGKICIHPNQVAIANGIFDPTAEELARAQRVVEAFRAAEREGKASVAVDGRLVDYPIVERALRLLAMAELSATQQRPA